MGALEILEGAHGKAAAEAGLENDWETDVEVKESDMVLQPRAIASNADTKTCCGTKTNQIVMYNMKADDTSVIIDGHDCQIWALSTSPAGGYDNAVKVGIPLRWNATGGYENGVKGWNAKRWSYNKDIFGDDEKVAGLEDI